MNHTSSSRAPRGARILSAALLTGLLGGVPVASQATDWTDVARALGKSGTEVPGGIYRVGIPRTDLRVVLDRVELKPTFALGSWVAFRPESNSSMVIGDLVLTETEIAPVMTKLEGGIEITALHNHLLCAQPATFYTYVVGRGDPVKLASALHDGLSLRKTPLVNPPASAAGETPPKIDFDTAMLDQTLRAEGQIVAGVYQAGIRRAETSGGRAAITGDFVLTAAEVNPVLRALRQNGIEVTALHNHMLDEGPRLFFMHFWANDDAAKLARGLRDALDKINVARS